jgi:hypothetical protein
MNFRKRSIQAGAERKPVLDRRGIEATLVLLILGVEGTFSHPGSWNQNARFAATVAFVEPGTPYTGTFRIDGLKDSARLVTADWAQSPRGAFYSNKAPGVSLLAIVPYFLLYHVERSARRDPTALELTRINAFALNLWISVFWNVVAALALLRRLPRLGVHSREGAAVVAVVYSLATPVLPFGCSMWGHSTAAAFITLGTLDVAEGSRARCFLGGLWLGMAALTEYLAAVSLVTAAIFVLSGSDRSERLWKFASGSAAPVVALLVYHDLAFGSYFTSAPSLSNPVFLQPEKIAGLFGVPSPERLLRLLFGSGRGLFWQTPILLASVFGVVSWYRSGRRAFVAFAVATIALYALSISTMDGFQGGTTTSMRYMIVTLPFFCILLPELRAFGYRRTFLLLFAVSAANAFVLAATSTMYESYSPLSEFAYPDFWKGNVAFNPLLARIGVRGAVPTFALAAIWALALGWLLTSVLTSPRRSPEGVPS